MPVIEATVKLFDEKGIPFMHTLTNENGEYTFSGLQSGNYQISCVKDDIVLTVAESFFLQNNEIRTHDFQIKKDTSLSLCSISGYVLKENDENEKIGGAIVSLLDKTTRETVASTQSASDGEYLFYDVEAKDYILIATKQGYNKSVDNFITAKDNTIINTNLYLSVNPAENTGTISGVITHNSNIVSGAFVGLYKITNGVEQLIATTKTNAKGIYMFGKVESGEYKIKAKQNE